MKKLIVTCLSVAGLVQVVAGGLALAKDRLLSSREVYQLFLDTANNGGQIGHSCMMRDIRIDDGTVGEPKVKSISFDLSSNGNPDRWMHFADLDVRPNGVKVRHSSDAQGNTVIEESYFKRNDQADCDIFGCGSRLFDQRTTYVVNPDFKLVNYKYFLHRISATRLGQKEEMTDIDCGR